MKDVFLASNNEGKAERYTRLLKHARSSSSGQAGVDVSFRRPVDFGLENVKPEEDGATLAANAEIKARAYFGDVDGLSILANDSGFRVEGEGFIDTPKRSALVGANEHDLSKEEIAERMVTFWQDIARKHGGEVNAAWEEAFVLLLPDGTIKREESQRDVILTDTVHGDAHMQLPVRALYIVNATGKPAALQTPEEELVELQSMTDALVRLLSNI